MLKKNKIVYKFILFFFVFYQMTFLFLWNLPEKNNVYAALPFTALKATLSTSRFSYKAALSGVHAANSTTFTIQSSGQSDNDTGDLFPNDTICFNTVLSVIGCSENKTFTVQNIIANATPSTQYSTTVAIQNALANGDYVVATQAARMTVTFKPTTQLVSGNFLRLTIPAASTNYADGIPDAGGFDSNKLTTGNINVNITPTGFTKSATSLSSSADGHVILMTLSSTLTSGTEYSFVVGSASDSTLKFINPSPTGTSHTRGVADTYSITLQSEDASSIPQDTTIVKVAPIDGVLVSATVQLTISYTIGSIAASQSVCGLTTSVASTATSVPFGTILNGSFYNAAQSHTVTTNAYNGYSLTTQYDGALSKDGAGVTTIADTTCDGASCNTTTPGAWLTPANTGFGYTEDGNDAVWVTPTLYFRPFPTSPVEIMANTAAASSRLMNTCYRIAISGTQNTGFYFNKLTYTITPRF